MSGDSSLFSASDTTKDPLGVDEEAKDNVSTQAVHPKIPEIFKKPHIFTKGELGG